MTGIRQRCSKYLTSPTPLEEILNSNRNQQMKVGDQHFTVLFLHPGCHAGRPTSAPPIPDSAPPPPTWLKAIPDNCWWQNDRNSTQVWWLPAVIFSYSVPMVCWNAEEFPKGFPKDASQSHTWPYVLRPREMPGTKFHKTRNWTYHLRLNMHELDNGPGAPGRLDEFKLRCHCHKSENVLSRVAIVKCLFRLIFVIFSVLYSWAHRTIQCEVYTIFSLVPHYWWYY